MCLIVEEGARARRSFRRVRCWKVVEWDSELRTWSGPFYGNDSYEEGKVLKSDECIDVYCGIVSHGLHTYATESDASTMLRRLSRIYGGRFRLMRCKIPRFARFIEGIGPDGKRCYVSERLKVVKFV